MRVICFDLDNTLVDSVKTHTKAYNMALRELGYKLKKQKEYFKLLGKPKEELAKILIPGASKKKIEKITELHDKYLVNETYKDSKRLKHAIGTLKSLKKREFKIVITSNCNHSNIVAILRGAGISKNYFDGLIGNDDVDHSKPRPDEILKAGKLFNTKVEYMIGDSIYDVMAGKKAKVKTIAITSGYYDTKELKKFKPDYIIRNLKGLKGIL